MEPALESIVVRDSVISFESTFFASSTAVTTSPRRTSPGAPLPRRSFSGVEGNSLNGTS